MGLAWRLEAAFALVLAVVAGAAYTVYPMWKGFAVDAADLSAEVALVVLTYAGGRLSLAFVLYMWDTAHRWRIEGAWQVLLFPRGEG